MNKLLPYTYIKQQHIRPNILLIGEYEKLSYHPVYHIIKSDMNILSKKSIDKDIESGWVSLLAIIYMMPETINEFNVNGVFYLLNGLARNMGKQTPLFIMVSQHGTNQWIYDQIPIFGDHQINVIGLISNQIEIDINIILQMNPLELLPGRVVDLEYIRKNPTFVLGPSQLAQSSIRKNYQYPQNLTIYPINIAQHFNINTDNIYFTTSIEHAIYDISSSLGKSCTILHEDPISSKVSQVFKHLELKCQPFPLKLHGNDNLHELSSYILRHKPTLVILSSPHTLTGSVIDITHLANNVRRTKTLIIIDQTYQDYEPSKSLLHLVINHSNLILIRNFEMYGLIEHGITMVTASTNIITTLHKYVNRQHVNQLDILSASLRDESQIKNTFDFCLSERSRIQKKLQKHGIYSFSLSNAPILLIPFRHEWTEIQAPVKVQNQWFFSMKIANSLANNELVRQMIQKIP